MKHVAFVTVGWYWNPVEAWVLRNRLADAGVDAFVADEFFGSLVWVYTNAIRGIKVQVPRAQLDRAREVLARGKSDVFADLPGTTPEVDQRVCARCGSADLYQERFAVRLAFLAWAVVGFPVPFPSSAVECFDCGKRYGPPTSFRCPAGPEGWLLTAGFLVLFFVGMILAFAMGIMWLGGPPWTRVN